MNLVIRAIFSSFLAFLGIGCSGSQRPKENIQTVNVADLKPDEIQHKQLSEGQLRRISRLHKIFAEVDTLSLEKWIDNFKRDLDPDSEIAIFARVAEAYTSYCSQRDLSLEAKGDVFQTLLLRSMRSLKLKVLSLEEAREIFRGY